MSNGCHRQLLQNLKRLGWLLCCLLASTSLAVTSQLRENLIKHSDLLYDDPHKAIEIYKDLWQSALSQNHPELILWSAVKLNSALSNVGDLAEMRVILAKALPWAEKSAFPHFHAQLLIQHATILNPTTEGETISSILVDAERLANTSDDHLVQASVQIYLSREASRKGRVDVAAAHLHRAYQHLKKAPKDSRYYAIMNNFATIQTSKDEQKLQEGIRLLAEVTAYTKKNNLRFLGELSYANYAEALVKVQRLDEAQAAFQSSLEFATAVQDELGIAYGMSGIAAIDMSRKKYQQAAKQLLKAKLIFTKYGDHDAIITADMRLAECFNETGRSEEGLSLISKIRRELEQNSTPQFYRDVLEVEAGILETLGRTHEAMLSYKKVNELGEKIYSEKSQELAHRFFAEYEVERGEERTQLLEQKNRIQALELDSRSRTNTFMILALACAGLLMILIIVDFQRVKKRNREIQNLQQYIEKNILQRFLPPLLVQEILEGKSRLDDHAKTETVTIIFADLCQFTRATDQLGPETISHILNDFFVHMTEIIFAEGGTIDKFIGDAIMVIFGAPSKMSYEEQARRAVVCAQKMQTKLQDLNRDWEISEGHHFEMRIGIHQGPVVVGSFGGAKRSDYTVVGTSVNIAARLEGLAEPNSILVSEAITQYLPANSFEFRDHFRLRGLNQDMPLYRVIGRADECTIPDAS